MTGIVVRPMRFTDNIEPMRAFLELIGRARGHVDLGRPGPRLPLTIPRTEAS